MEFIWHDGGRAACGFVGHTGDCVTRAIAIATGEVYREVYDALTELAQSSARHGVTVSVADQYLRPRGWRLHYFRSFDERHFVPGANIVSFRPTERKSSGHLSCVIDKTIYDTWNPFEDHELEVDGVWTLAVPATGTTLPIRAPGLRAVTDQARLTQHEFERILKRVRALHRTASNEASTEGEVRNALRAMQSLMLEHNLSRDDLVDDQQLKSVGMTRRACPLNGLRATQWELGLANYLVNEVFSAVQFYSDRHGHRTFFWFYGPVDEVNQALGLFQEMLLTIAAAARLKYGSFARGRGASYAEGYVFGLPRQGQPAPATDSVSSQRALIHSRNLALRSSAEEWLNIECGVEIVRYMRSSGRNSFDPHAHREGTRDGAKHETGLHHRQKRLTDMR